MIRLRDLGEFGTIERLARLVPKPSNLVVGIGDDCAIYRSDDYVMAATSDLVIQDVHFRFASEWSEDIGWKAAAVNLSDIAAMGAVPLFATVSCGAPGEFEIEDLEAIYRGLIDCFSAYGTVLAGGDTTRSEMRLVLDVCVIGDARDGYVLRSGAKPGDAIAITGYPGRSSAGLQAQESGVEAPELIMAHRRPTPRVLEGRWLGKRAHAMIDVSDGVVQDAGHIAESSAGTIDLDANALPIAEDLATFADEIQIEPQSFALAGGEDYELLVALESDAAGDICQAFEDEFRIPLTVIGSCQSGTKGVTVNGEKIAESGFDHFRSI